MREAHELIMENEGDLLFDNLKGEGKALLQDPLLAAFSSSLAFIGDRR